MTLVACQQGRVSSTEVSFPIPSGVVVDGTPDVPIGSIRQFGRHLDGYFLLDYQNHRVLLIAADGSVRRVLGRRGGAPDEFQNPHDVSAASDGRLVVHDPPIVTVFDSLGEARHRFVMPVPEFADVDWVCNDSLISYSRYGDVSGLDPEPVIELFSEDGTGAGKTGPWPKWTDSMNNSVSGLLYSERDCVVTAVEALGRRIGRVAATDGAQVTNQREIPWWTNGAAFMTIAYNQTGHPEGLGTSFWTNLGIWHINGDTVLVQQDSTGADRGWIMRYELIADSSRARSINTNLEIMELTRDSFVFKRQREDGSIEIGTAPLSGLLDPLRAAMGPAPDRPD